ncbi:TonB-dependent siderophore receptor, partial [Pseudomonas syringae]
AAPWTRARAHTGRRLDGRQDGLFATDRHRFNEHWQTVLGGRGVRLDEQAFNEDGSDARHTARYVFLPQAALIYKPVDNVSRYSSYSKGLSLGGTAAWLTTNASDILAPPVSRQQEAGITQHWPCMSPPHAGVQARQAYQPVRPDAG